MTNVDTLKSIVTQQVFCWHLLRKTPDAMDYRSRTEDAFPEMWAQAGREPYRPKRRNEPAPFSGEFFIPTALRVEELMKWVQALCAKAPAELDLGWVQRDPLNPPSVNAAMTLFMVILAPTQHRRVFVNYDLITLCVNRADMLMLCFWVLRQRGLIAADIWGGIMRCIYVTQKPSIRMALTLTDEVLSEMLESAGDTGLFVQNETIKSREDIPATVRLYRGLAADKVWTDFMGFSWADDWSKAEYFALQRSGKDTGGAKIVSATFGQREILAVLEHGDGFNEWLIRKDSTPKDITVHAIEFDIRKFRYEARLCEADGSRLTAVNDPA